MDEAIETSAPMAAGAAASRPLLAFGCTNTGATNCQHTSTATALRQRLITRLRPRRAMMIASPVGKIGESYFRVAEANCLIQETMHGPIILICHGLIVFAPNCICYVLLLKTNIRNMARMKQLLLFADSLLAGSARKDEQARQELSPQLLRCYFSQPSGPHQAGSRGGSG